MKYLFLTILILSTANFYAQNISGKVEADIPSIQEINVRLLNTNFKTQTDSLGHYQILVKAKDSVWFSLFGKHTQKYTIDTIEDLQHFNIMIHVTGYDLPEVRVRNSYYKLDSMQNRADYAKFFNYSAPGLKLSNNQNLLGPNGLTIGFDLDEIINMFRVKRNRNLQFLQIWCNFYLFS